MTVTIAAQRDLARWLLEEELSGRQGPDALVEAAERACQKLSGRVATLVTTTGYRALFARALFLTRAEFPFLSAVQVGAIPENCFDGLRDGVSSVTGAELRDGLAAVLAGIMGLLATFIGDDLTVRLVRDVWPAAPFDEAVPNKRRA